MSRYSDIGINSFGEPIVSIESKTEGVHKFSFDGDYVCTFNYSNYNIPPFNYTMRYSSFSKNKPGWVILDANVISDRWNSNYGIKKYLVGADVFDLAYSQNNNKHNFSFVASDFSNVKVEIINGNNVLKYLETTASAGKQNIIYDFEEIPNSTNLKFRVYYKPYYDDNYNANYQQGWNHKEIDFSFLISSPIISNFTQTPNPIYKGSIGTVTCNLIQGNGDLTYQWSGYNFPAGATFTPNGNKATIYYNYNRVASLDILRTDYNNREIRVPEPTLICTVTNSVGNSSGVHVVHLINQPFGGCPFVYTWDGEDWVEDNNILPQSQIPGNEGIDVRDYYQLYTIPVEHEGKYFLAVGEFENEISSLDKLQLLLIDHPEDTYVTVDDEGNIIQFAKPSFFADASLDSVDVYKQLYEQDGNIAEVSESDTLELMFEDADPDTDQWLLLIANVKAHVAKREVAGRLLDKNRNTFSTFRLRKNPSYQWALVPASGSTTMELGVYWENDAEIDFAELSRVLELPFDSHVSELLSAEHSVRGDVLDKLLNEDEDYAELQPNEWINLEYNAPPIPEGKQRSFIFISKGRYETLIDTTNSNKLAKENSGIEEMGYEYALFQNYPNPFNPSTVIKYQLKESGEVTIKLYDVLGNEVYTLINEYKEKGLYEVNFNSFAISSGVYFCIIKSKDFTATRKMILMR